MANPLDRETNVLVTVEDPPWFESLVEEWLHGGCTCALSQEERNYKPDEENSTERSQEERLKFAREIRAAGHQGDLEKTQQRPVFSITPPGGFPVQRPDSGAILVTRKARDMLATGPLDAVQDTAVIPVIDVTVGEDADSDPADGD